MRSLLPKLRKIKLTPKVYLRFPEEPGVYIYFREDIPIYIGKAINLKKRISSYFRVNLEPKTRRMIDEAEEISLIKVASELEALLLEAKLIKAYLPKYNIAAKDDKHPLYILISKEEYPRVTTVRKADLDKSPALAIFGPFPSSTNVRSVLKMLRRIFPYSDHKIGKRACLYSQIGLCDPCPNEIRKINNPELRSKLKKLYLRNIKHIKSLLNGRIDSVKNELVKEMKAYSDSRNYEEAAEIRNKIQRLEYITSPKNSIDSYIENPNLFEDIRERELRDLRKTLGKHSLQIKSLKRIECFDAAHLQGTNATASMVTFFKGIPDKNYYRHFRIRQIKGQDDYESMREVSRRRKKHLSDWGRPDLIIVDGGKGQLSVFLREFEEEKIPVIGLAKRFETLVIPVKYLGTTEVEEFKLPNGPALNLVQRIRDEAHRFARVYHHKLLSKSLIERSS